MVRFPNAPDTLVTLQIECVSCQEIFTLAEDEANAMTRSSWRMPTAGPGHTEMEPRPENTRHLVRPLARSTPNQDPESWERWGDNKETAVNCPRCGTDNRNWLRLAYAPHPGSKWERFWARINKFTLTWISIILTIFLLGRLLFRERENDHLFIYALMIVIIILATIIPIMAITGQWRKERTHKIVTKFNETLPFYKRFSPSLTQGVLYFSLFVLLIPAVVYILLPAVTGRFKSEQPLVERIDQAVVSLDPEKIQTLQTTDSKQLVPTENALASMQSMMPKNLFLCDPEAIDTLLTTLTTMDMNVVDPQVGVRVDNAIYHLGELQKQVDKGTCDPQTVTNAIMPLGALYTEEWQHCATAAADELAQDPVCSNPTVVSIVEYLRTAAAPGSPLFVATLADEIQLTLKEARKILQETNDPEIIARIESELAVIENGIDYANNGPTTFPGTSDMLNTWLKYVGLSCLIAVITAVVSTNIYASKVNKHLPQPLCYSLSRLTRVVMWEARHSLEINGHFDRIEWHEAYRNRNGGITLRGHLCPPSNGQSAQKYVRAMSYNLVSDLWGHVIVAEAKPVRVSPSVMQAWQVHEEQMKNTLDKLFISK